MKINIRRLCNKKMFHWVRILSIFVCVKETLKIKVMAMPPILCPPAFLQNSRIRTKRTRIQIQHKATCDRNSISQMVDH